MDHDILQVQCWDPQCTGVGHFLIIRIRRGKVYEGFVTYVCPHHQNRYKHVVQSGGAWWHDDLILEMMRQVEAGKSWVEITSNLNSLFNTSFSGVQRPSGKGYRGDVSRKYSRMAKIDWIPGEPHTTLLPKVIDAFKKNNQRAISSHERG